MLCFSTGTCNQCKPQNKHDTFQEQLFSLKIWEEKLHNLPDNVKYLEKSKQTRTYLGVVCKNLWYFKIKNRIFKETSSLWQTVPEPLERSHSSVVKDTWGGGASEALQYCILNRVIPSCLKVSPVLVYISVCHDFSKTTVLQVNLTS